MEKNPKHKENSTSHHVRVCIREPIHSTERYDIKNSQKVYGKNKHHKDVTFSIIGRLNTFLMKATLEYL
jgi:hypothetical protein